jgi:hypothetical protein
MINNEDYTKEKKETIKKKKKPFSKIFLFISSLFLLLSLFLSLSITSAKMVVPEKVIEINKTDNQFSQYLPQKTIRILNLINFDSMAKIILIISITLFIIAILNYINRRSSNNVKKK